MKIRPVILCGGAGTRLWPNAKKHQAKQFIDFGNWTLLGKTLDRVKASIFDTPIISTNEKYLNQVKQHLRKHKISKHKIAGAVFLFAGSNTILYLFILDFLRCCFTSFRYFLLVLMIGESNIDDLILSRVFPSNVQFPKSINCLAW